MALALANILTLYCLLLALVLGTCALLDVDPLPLIFLLQFVCHFLRQWRSNPVFAPKAPWALHADHVCSCGPH